MRVRQWDTKKQFKPDYRGCARLIFTGWLTAARYPSWGYYWRITIEGMAGLTSGVAGVALGVAFLALSPITLPLLCIGHKMTRRKARLRYIRRNRRVDSLI